MNARGRPRDPRFGGRGHEPPHVEVAAVLLVRRRCEEQLHHPPCVLLELAALGRRVAVAEDQEIDLVRRVAILLELDERSGRRPATTCPRTCPWDRRRRSTRRGTGSSRPACAGRSGPACPARESAAIRETCDSSPWLRRSFPTRRTPTRNRANRARVRSARSRTSKKYLPRLVRSIGCFGLPGHSSGSTTTRSTLKSSCFALPVWK